MNVLWFLFSCFDNFWGRWKLCYDSNRLAVFADLHHFDFFQQCWIISKEQICGDLVRNGDKGQDLSVKAKSAFGVVPASGSYQMSRKLSRQGHDDLLRHWFGSIKVLQFFINIEHCNSLMRICLAQHLPGSMTILYNPILFSDKATKQIMKAIQQNS